MRTLKRSTVLRAFAKRGWYVSKDDTLTSPDVNAGPRIFGNWVHGGSMLRLHDARLRGHSNFHLVSYWGPFQSMRELHDALARIEAVYSEFCGTRFPPKAAPCASSPK